MSGQSALTRTKRTQQKSKTSPGVHGGFFVFLDVFTYKKCFYSKDSFQLNAWKVVTLGGSLAGSLKSPTKIGWYFLKMTFDTAKFLSNNSIFCRNSGLTLDISAHFWALLKNSIRLNLLDRKRRVRETPLPWIVAPAWPTVGKDEFRHATYKAQANQWIWSP